MQSETQSQIFKVCNSCKRALHFSCFGISRKSKNGFSFCCKECRNYRRRRSYHNSIDREVIILPINENNQKVILDAIKASAGTEIPALNVHNKNVFFKFQVHADGALEFDLRDGGQRCIFFSRSCQESFVRITTHFLSRQGVRLFSLDQPLAIHEWKVSINPVSS